MVAFDKTGTLTKGSTEVTDFLYRTEQADTFGPLHIPSVQHEQFISPRHQPHGSIGHQLGVAKEARYLLQLMHLAECRSSHPLAKGITAFCKSSITALDRQITQQGQMQEQVKVEGRKDQYVLPLEQDLLFDVIPGLGIRMYTTTPALAVGTVDVLVGSGKLLQSMNVPIPADAAARASSYRAGGKVAVYVSVNGVLRAIVGTKLSLLCVVVRLLKTYIL